MAEVLILNIKSWGNNWGRKLQLNHREARSVRGCLVSKGALDKMQIALQTLEVGKAEHRGERRCCS